MRAVGHMVDLARIPDTEITGIMDISADACHAALAQANAETRSADCAT